MWSSVHGHAEDRQTTRLWREVNGVWQPEFFYFFLLLLFVFGLEAKAYKQLVLCCTTVVAWFHLVASLPPSHCLSPLPQWGGRRKSETKKNQESSLAEIKTLPNYPHGQNRLGLGNLSCFGNTCKEGSSRKFNWTLDQAAWRWGGASLTGDIQKPSEHTPYWCAPVDWLCLSQEVGLNDCWCSLPTLPISTFRDSNLQPVEVFDHPFSKDIHPDVQSKALLNKLTSSSSCSRNREAWGRCGFPFIQQEAQVALLNKQMNFRSLIIFIEISCRSLLFCFHFFKQQIPFMKGEREQPLLGRMSNPWLAFNISHYFLITQLQKARGRNHWYIFKLMLSS